MKTEMVLNRGHELSSTDRDGKGRVEDLDSGHNNNKLYNKTTTSLTHVRDRERALGMLCDDNEPSCPERHLLAFLVFFISGCTNSYLLCYLCSALLR